MRFWPRSPPAPAMPLSSGAFHAQCRRWSSAAGSASAGQLGVGRGGDRLRLGHGLSGACISGHHLPSRRGRIAGADCAFRLARLRRRFATWNTLYLGVIAGAPTPWLPAWLYSGALAVHLIVSAALALVLLRRIPEQAARPAQRITPAHVRDAVLKRALASHRNRRTGRLDRDLRLPARRAAGRHRATWQHLANDPRPHGLAAGADRTVLTRWPVAPRQWCRRLPTTAGWSAV